MRQAARSAATTKAILAAAQELFKTRGYEAVSIDEIAQAAGYKKGAFYHQFPSKRDVFEQVLDGVQAGLAARLMERAAGAPKGASPRAVAQSIQAYVESAIQPDARRILLIDGPVVLGWQRWREIDDKHFAGIVRASVTGLMGRDAKAAQIESATRLLLGAIMEAALASGTADDPAAAARAHCATLELLLSGLCPSSGDAGRA
ncbi:MAG: TetR/AcrR family transcriptional regulator [Phenylobacterium sp.]|uniref:TetR/AcrR family transcriptional regulator n=1 Tax=Phenylobacterium sp. TaxID=1871053 RepID=UPI0027345789|nr:TetR/AcrR family transcriptional regulator [Phenylobacterium sp.]MDP3748296.1 TetR/AcrR family transcriptional regulator [Phenylobacterium sp.]